MRSTTDLVDEVGSAVCHEQAATQFARSQIAGGLQSRHGESPVERERSSLVDGDVSPLAADAKHVQFVAQQRNSAHCHVRQRHADLEVAHQS